jgi:hypothetical protein
LTDRGHVSSYLGDTQREVNEMNGMLQNQEHFQHEIERHQREAREWSRSAAMGRRSRSVRTARAQRRPARNRVLLTAAPLTLVSLVLLVII